MGSIFSDESLFEILNSCETPPFTPSQADLPGEDLRLKYRFLDLRRGEMQRAMVLRSTIVKTMRDYFAEHDFIDVETPILGRSTPEGARDYLVPSRVHPANFYALPQSPQLYKQILMVAGFDRYIQVAKCFRDEDLRADRQPEFTQLDLEMSFVDADDVMGLIDGLVAKTAKEVLGKDVKTPLPRMTFDEAMRRFGSDAPDLRFGMEIVDVTEVAKKTEFRVFRGTADAGGCSRSGTATGVARRARRSAPRGAWRGARWCPRCRAPTDGRACRRRWAAAGRAAAAACRCSCRPRGSRCPRPPAPPPAGARTPDWPARASAP